MSDDSQQQQGGGGKAPKSGIDALLQIEEKNYSNEIGKVRKQLEEKVPLRDKAREALNQVQTEIDALVIQYDELMAKKASVRR